MSIYKISMTHDVSRNLHGFTWDSYIVLKAADDRYWYLARVVANPDSSVTLTLIDTFHTASGALAGAKFDKQRREGN